MKIVFVENRYKTVLFEKVASKLESDGIDIVFLVQNHCFKPKRFKSYLIPYPTKEELGAPNKEIELMNLQCKDRGYRFFSAGNRHYNHYLKHIQEFIVREEPDFVFGEATLFHELITLDFCRKNNTTYLHPTSCRYPTGHMSFYEFDTLIPYKECLNVEVDESDRTLANNISERKVVPEYMNFKLSKLVKIRNNLHSVFTLSKSYFSGERFNTPSPIQKIAQNLRIRLQKREWEKTACKDLSQLSDWNKVVVYPLQMQPEANLDVWGYPYNNQLENIKLLAQSLPEKWFLVIKPNPKSKFELSEELYNYVMVDKRVIHLSHYIGMNEIFNKANHYFSVTGTICIETLFSSKYGYSPSLPHIKYFAADLYKFPSEESLSSPLCKVNEAERLIAYLRKNSYKGMITDHFHSSNAYSATNIQDLYQAFKSVLQSKNIKD